jgi:NolX protein
MSISFTNIYNNPALSGAFGPNAMPPVASQQVGTLMQSLAGLLAALAPMLQNAGLRANPQSSQLGGGFGPAPQWTGAGNGQGFQGTGGGAPVGGSPFGGFPALGLGNPTHMGINPFEAQQALQPPMTQDRAAQVLSEHYDNIPHKNGKGSIGRESLEAVAKDPKSPPELKEAAQYLLDNPLAFSQMDTANRTKTGKGDSEDGWIGKKDLAATTQSTPFSAAEKGVVNTFMQHKDQLLGGDGLMSLQELSKIATTGKLPNGQPAPADLLNAAQFATANPAFFSKLEEAYMHRNPGAKGERNDAKVGVEDLQVALGR